MMKNDEDFMMEAIKQAELAQAQDEVPIGCVIVKDGKIIAKAHNEREGKQRTIAHAEILAIEKANKKLGSWRLDDCTLYVTLEPCPMCAGAILLSRIAHVVYGARDRKGGCVETCMKMYETAGFNHYPTAEGGVLEEACASLLQSFFQKKRGQKKAKQNQKKNPAINEEFQRANDK